MVRRALLKGSTLQEIAEGSKNLVANLTVKTSERKNVAKIHKEVLDEESSVSDSSRVESVNSIAERSEVSSSDSSDGYEATKQQAMAMIDFARVTKKTKNNDI